jgi:hypothetical protein
VLARRVSIVSRPPHFVVAIVLVTLGANSINVAVEATVGTWTDTLRGISASGPSFLTSPAISLSVWNNSGVSNICSSVYGVTTIHALVRNFVIGAAKMIVAWISSVAGTALDFIVTCVKEPPSAGVDSNRLTGLLVLTQIVVLLANFTQPIRICVTLASINRNSTMTVSISSRPSISAKTTAVSVVNVGDTVNAVVFSTV